MLSDSIKSFRVLFFNNLKIVENYFFMTALQLLSSLFGILIYPYVIRTLGAESYGQYVFALSITTYFITFISFGFSLPGTKMIAQNKHNQAIKSEVVSSIFTAKFYLGLISTVVFAILLLTISGMMQNRWIYIICFAQIIGEILFPSWYFQGVQKMKVVTFIQLGFRILSLPFIIMMVKAPSDCLLFVTINTLAVVFGGIAVNIILIRYEKLKLQIVSLKNLKHYFKDALPFFWSSSVGTIKQSSVSIIIGSVFGMSDLALYDLANKLIILPRMLTISINGALFPKVIQNINASLVRKIIRYEIWIGVLVSILIAALGYWVVLLLAGPTMTAAYPMAVVLSLTVLSWLVVGSYINFIFVPAGRYYLVTQNQIVAALTFFFYCIPLFFVDNMMIVVTALTLSGLTEIVFCNVMIKKLKLL